MLGILLGFLRQNGTLTGIRAVDSTMAAIDASLREYVFVVEGYFSSGEEVTGGPSVVDMLGAAVNTSRNGQSPDTDEDDDSDTEN